MSYYDENLRADYDNEVSVRFWPDNDEGDWFTSVSVDGASGADVAGRDDLMETLAEVDMILIRAQYYSSGPVDVTVSDVELETAVPSDSGLGQTSNVEQCLCPAGYTGLSCELCAPGYQRQPGGECRRPVTSCPPGYYGDPSSGLECQVCPCPLTTPSNQFGRECYLDTDRQVTCQCPPGYTGRRCGECEAGYQGNPVTLGGSCTKGKLSVSLSIVNLSNFPCVSCVGSKLRCCCNNLLESYN